MHIASEKPDYPAFVWPVYGFVGPGYFNGREVLFHAFDYWAATDFIHADDSGRNLYIARPKYL